MSKILEKYEELKNLAPLDVPQPKITDSYKSKDATPYTKGQKDRQAADDESGIVTLESKTGFIRYGLAMLGVYGWNKKNPYGGQQRK